MSFWEESNIMFLKGVHLDDYISIENMFEEELLSTDMPSQQYDVEVFYKNPSTFSGLDNWPKQTNLHCWYCSLSFTGMPWFIINFINNTPKGVTMDVRGNFCGCGCLMGWIKQNIPARDAFDKVQNAHRLYEIVYGKRTTHIETPMNMYAMQMFGGDLTLEEYRKHVSKINKINTLQISETRGCSGMD